MLVNMYIYIFMQFLCSAYMHISGDKQPESNESCDGDDQAGTNAGSGESLIDGVNY